MVATPNVNVPVDVHFYLSHNIADIEKCSSILKLIGIVQLLYSFFFQLQSLGIWPNFPQFMHLGFHSNQHFPQCKLGFVLSSSLLVNKVRLIIPLFSLVLPVLLNCLISRRPTGFEMLVSYI